MKIRHEITEEDLVTSRKSLKGDGRGPVDPFEASVMRRFGLEYHQVGVTGQATRYCKNDKWDGESMPHTEELKEYITHIDHALWKYASVWGGEVEFPEWVVEGEDENEKSNMS